MIKTCKVLYAFNSKIEKSYLTKFKIFSDKNDFEPSSQVIRFFNDIDNLYKNKRIYIWYGSLIIKPIKLCELNKIYFEIDEYDELKKFNVRVFMNDKWIWLHSVYNISNTVDCVNCVQKYFLSKIFL